MKTRAAVAIAAGKPLEIMEVDLEGPREGEGVGPERHGMLQSALLVGSMCLKGLSTDEIRQRAAQGLKG